MKLSFSTLGCPAWDLSRVAEEAKKNGVDGVELRDVARFEDGDVHGLRNDGNAELIYLSVTAPPIDFGYAYRSTS